MGNIWLCTHTATAYMDIKTRINQITFFWLDIKNILVFPEGTRVAPGVVKPFKVGVARMAKELDLLVVPVVNNAGYCMPRSSYMLYPGIVEVIIDKPLKAEINEPADKFTARIEEVVRRNLAKISK
ncbi:MAG: 1-acyl-sn-glycerol-3-phosphate acyltransferase [Burkholderiales bacterium]|nr:1-acyl-sn-glycerol-3-phosphate acyltransferase [Burkholderiales bacterium]